MLDLNSASASNQSLSGHAKSAFRKGVVLQQFLNSNGPIFKAFAAAGKNADEIVSGEDLIAVVNLANELSIAVATKFFGTSSITHEQVQLFRPVTTEYIANCWAEGNQVEVGAAANQIASMLELIDQSWIAPPETTQTPTSKTQALISCVDAAGALHQAISIYSFRYDPEVLLKRLMTEVIEAAHSSAKELLLNVKPTRADTLELTQALLRNFSSIMVSCYERHSRETILRLVKKTEEEKLEFFETSDPIGLIIADFNELYATYAGMALLASQVATSHSA